MTVCLYSPSINPVTTGVIGWVQNNNQKEVAQMNILDLLSTGAKQLRFKAARTQISLVRRERGCRAPGEVLLLSALRSLSREDGGAAFKALKQFRQVPDLSIQHRLIINIACSKLRLSGIISWNSIHQVLKVVALLLSTLAAWKSRLPLNCKILFLYRLPVNQWTLAKLQSKTLLYC